MLAPWSLRTSRIRVGFCIVLYVLNFADPGVTQDTSTSVSESLNTSTGVGQTTDDTTTIPQSTAVATSNTSNSTETSATSTEQTFTKAPEGSTSASTPATDPVSTATQVILSSASSTVSDNTATEVSTRNTPSSPINNLVVTNGHASTILSTSPNINESPITLSEKVESFIKQVNERGDNPETTEKPESTKEVSETDKKPESAKKVLIALITTGLLLAALIVAGYFLSSRQQWSPKGKRLDEDQNCVENGNQGNTLVSVTPLEQQEQHEKSNLNGGAQENGNSQTLTTTTNGQSSTKQADTEL